MGALSDEKVYKVGRPYDSRNTVTAAEDRMICSIVHVSFTLLQINSLQAVVSQ